MGHWKAFGTYLTFKKRKCELLFKNVITERNWIKNGFKCMVESCRSWNDPKCLASLGNIVDAENDPFRLKGYALGHGPCCRLPAPVAIWCGNCLKLACCCTEASLRTPVWEQPACRPGRFILILGSWRLQRPMPSHPAPPPSARSFLWGSLHVHRSEFLGHHSWTWC